MVARSTDNTLLAGNEEECTISSTESCIRLATTRFYSAARSKRRERELTLHSSPLPHRPSPPPSRRLVRLLSYLVASRLPLLRSLKLAKYLPSALRARLEKVQDELRRGVDGGVYFLPLPLRTFTLRAVVRSMSVSQ